MNDLWKVTLDADGEDIILVVNLKERLVYSQINPNSKIKDKDQKLTYSQQQVICKLAENINQAVSYSDLYASYSDSDGDVSVPNDSNTRITIAKLKATFPYYIRESIVSERKIGYKLIAKSMVPIDKTKIGQHENTHEGHERLYDLVGDYYGFYLDPLGTGATLATYIHIDQYLNAYAILNIRNDEILSSNRIPTVFRPENQENYYNSFKKFQKDLDENNQRCSFGEGTISSDGSISIITLRTPHGRGEKWTIVIDQSNYLSCARSHSNENDRYRGGLGLVFASRTTNGTMCFRIGLVRKKFFKSFFSLDNDEIKSRLQILDDSRNAIWRPLKLSGFLDKIWYNWIMG